MCTLKSSIIFSEFIEIETKVKQIKFSILSFFLVRKYPGQQQFVEMEKLFE